MRRSLVALPIVTVVLALAAHCGGAYNSNTTPTGGGVPPANTPQPTGGPVTTNAVPGNLITISGLAFDPPSLQVTPGTVVTVRNLDGMPHSVTSEASVNAFRFGAVAGISFDTGAFMGDKTFTIPTTATAGTVVPYFCTVHTSTMATPNGQIEVVAAGATPQQTPTPM